MIEKFKDRLSLSVDETAEILGLSPWTIRKWIREGTLQHIRLGRRVMVEPKVIQALVDKGAQG